MSSGAAPLMGVESAFGGAAADLLAGIRLDPGNRDLEEALGGLMAGLDLAGSLDAERLIPTVLQHACETLDASRATLLSVDGGDVLIEGAYDVDGQPVARGWRGAMEDQPLLHEAMEGAHLTAGDAAQDDGLSHQVAGAADDVRHALVVPLRVRDSVNGFIVAMRRQPPPFAHECPPTLPLLGTIALQAMHHSRRHADAEAASRTMAGFLNFVVHDLRTPLTVLSGYVDLLRDGTFGAPPANWQRPMDMIAVKLTETQRLVDDILLAARIEAGAVPTSSERLDLNEVVGRAAARSEARALLVGARVEVAPHPAAVVVEADSFHVDRIIDNLLNNAITYGGSSPWVRLSIDASARPAVRVEDHGVGISPELHGRIFDRFFRVDNEVPGTGFGLHVAQVLAEACSGSLRVERSVPGEGSVFRLELPPAGEHHD